MATSRETDRLRTLLETGIAISSELSLDAVLERIVEAAARVTGARCAALGVIDRFVTLLAAQAAVAIENARLYESATAWSRQLESLNEVGNALVTELELPRLLELVAARLRELIAARDVAIALVVGDELRVEAAVGERS